MKERIKLITSANCVDYCLTSYNLNILSLPKLSDSKSESAKLKMKKLDGVLMYGILQMLKHVRMFPGIPSNDMIGYRIDGNQT